MHLVAPSGIALTEDGASLVWTATGRGDPVVLIAGQAVTMHSWDPAVPALADRFKVIMYDQRGIGATTEGTEPPSTTRAMAQDVQHLLSAIGIARAHVVGHSMGGRVAQWLAIDHPDAVGALALIATTGGDTPARARTPEATADLASGDAGRLAHRFFSDSYLREHPAAIEVFVRKEGSLATRRRAFHASSTHDAWARLGGIRSPTLVVHGSADTITTEPNGRALAEQIPRAEYLEVVDGRHAPHIDDPRVTEVIADFLQQHPLTG